MSNTLRLVGKELAAGRHHVEIPITTDLNGSDIILHAHVVVGAKPGKTLTVVAAQHGLEWMPIEVIRQVLDELDPNEMSGAFLALPVASPPTLGILRRNTPDDSDNADLNRVYPGYETWIAEQLASTIVREVLPITSGIVDFHWGIWGSCMGDYVYGEDFDSAEAVAAGRAMARAFKHPVVRGGQLANFPGFKSLVGYAGSQLGIPGVIGGVGGAGFGPERELEWMELNRKGLHNVMRVLEILPGEPAFLERYLSFDIIHRVNPRVGGLFFPEREHEEFGRPVAKGEVLGKVVSPYTFKTMEVLTSPCEGYLLYFARWYPVRPGDWTFAVIPKDDPSTTWVNN